MHKYIHACSYSHFRMHRCYRHDPAEFSPLHILPLYYLHYCIVYYCIVNYILFILSKDALLMTQLHSLFCACMYDIIYYIIYTTLCTKRSDTI